MNIRQAIKMAWKSIWGKKGRAVLTMLGIIIGIASVMTIVSVITGYASKMMEQFEAMGTNRISVNVYCYAYTSDENGNMVALGAWLRATGALPLTAVQEALRRVVSAHYARLIPVNAQALEAGYNVAADL